VTPADKTVSGTVLAPGKTVPDTVLSRASASTAAPASPYVEGVLGHGGFNRMAARRLLLVEDSSTMRRMIATLLGEQGYEVRTAVDGLDGLDKARAEPRPELILSDYEMPRLDGPNFCREVKSDRLLRSTPVLMLTTIGGIETKLAGFDSGADDFIEKPRSPEEVQELFARIRAHLRIADLRAELAERNRLLEQAQRKMTFELDLARKVQLALMPHPPSPRGALRLGVWYRPANQLGGDVYDFYRLDGGRLGILVADVSGHGVNSAMLSGMVKALAAPLAEAVAEPGELLKGLDAAGEQFFPEGYFCTAIYLVADERTGDLRYAGVGHPPALVVGPNGPRALTSLSGMLGVGMVGAIGAEADRLGPGESLVIYTDGLTDAMGPGDVLFGEARLSAVLQAHQAGGPDEILGAVDEAVTAHTAPGRPADDINVIVLQHPAG
jgi:sigma-B regulation protein RsbU (phosphoserine phosphatase)